MAKKIRKIESIPSGAKVNPDHILKRSHKDAEKFRNKLQKEIEKRIKNQNKR